MSLSAFAQDSVRTIAGRALQAGMQDGPALQARFNDPAALVCDKDGILYVADSRNNVIRRIAPGGIVTTIAASNPSFHTPSGLAISTQGIFVADTGNHIIRRINLNGSVVTIAGAPGQNGHEDGAASAARFDTPLGLAVAANGTVYVADCGNHLIRAISPDNIVTTIAGSPDAWGATDGLASGARFNGPIGVAMDAHGNLFASDSNNHTIRKITPGRDVTTFAGVALQTGFVDGARDTARFFQPAELAFDSRGALYVADSMNHAIRKISAEGEVSTVTGFQKKSGADDGHNGHARLYNPYGVAVLPSGELAISDAYNQTIREALPPTELRISRSRAFSLIWNSAIGKTYQLQIADPRFQQWLNFGNAMTATDFTAHTLIPNQTAVGFFRVVAIP